MLYAIHRRMPKITRYSGPILGIKQTNSKVTDKWEIGKNSEVSIMNNDQLEPKGWSVHQIIILAH